MTLPASGPISVEGIRCIRIWSSYAVFVDLITCNSYEQTEPKKETKNKIKYIKKVIYVESREKGKLINEAFWAFFRSWAFNCFLSVTL